MKSLPFRLLLSSIFAALLTACQMTQPETPPLPTFAPEKLGTVEKDITYCTIDDTDLKLDVYYPPRDDGPWPVVVHVHGGGWSGGSKNNSFLFPDLTDMGLVGVEVGYRLSPDVVFPAHIQDVKCAVRYLRAHAADYNIDPDQILAVGDSAGGHLVSLLGLTADSGEWNDAGQWLDTPANVKAVVSISGPTDLNAIACFSDYTRELTQLVFNAQEPCGVDSPILIEASPMTYIHPDAPPFLIIAGTADIVVPYEQSVAFQEKLAAQGVDAELYLVEGGAHNLETPGDPLAVLKALVVLKDYIRNQLELR